MAKSKEISVGSTESQIETFTEKINNINNHLDSNNKKDNSARRGLLLLVSKRRKLLKYLKRRDLEGYRVLTEKLKIRK